MYGALTGMMGGLGLGQFNFSVPTEGSMTKPVNPNTANQQAQTTTPVATASTPTNTSFQLFIDGQPLYTSWKEKFSTDPGLKTV
jgi:hypothetical protein